MKKQKLLFVLAVGVFFAGLTILVSPSVSAAATITVDSTADTIADDGVCTLREAITSANADAALGADPNECEDGFGTDTINFNIPGTGVHSISLVSVLPNITDTVIINGYSESDAVQNTAVSPQPLNSTLVIRLNGSGLGAGDDGLYFAGGATGSAGSEIRGLVISNFPGDGIILDADNVVIQGNYIGTNPAGTAAEGNETAVNHFNLGSSNINALIGGLDPEDRNILSGQTSSASFPVDSWTIQGNYVGLAKDGISAIPNSTVTLAGAFSIDNCDGVTVGGTDSRAVNVISGNNSYGVAPDNATNLTVQGNLIGTDYTGTLAVPNSVGIIASGDLTGSVIGGTTVAARNIISGNTIGGYVSGATGGYVIAGNYIGLDIQGDDPLPNGLGLLISDSGTTIGGGTSARNVISGNTAYNVSVQKIDPSLFAEDNVISGNYIGTNASGNVDSAITAVQGEGVRISAAARNNLVGKSDNVVGSVGNRIAGNRDAGIAVRSYTANNFGPLTVTPVNNAVLGNEIYSNTSSGPIAAQTGLSTLGLGIDIYDATLDVFTGAPLPADFFADSYTNLGLTPNDISDVDTGSNSFMNSPVINSAIQNGTTMSVNLNLDANNADTSSNTYRVEFFANDSADPSGYGEGQTYLGYANVANGNSQDLSVSIPNGTNLTGKVLSATTTAINTATNSGFGATSEFSLASSNITVVAAAVTNNTPLAKTGDDTRAIIVLGVFFVVAGGTAVVTKRRNIYSVTR